MKENIIQKLTSKDDKYACAFTDRIVAESHDTDAVSTLKNENGAKITLVSTLKKALIQKLFSVSAAGKNLKEQIFFVSTFLDKYRCNVDKVHMLGYNIAKHSTRKSPCARPV